MEQGCRFEQHFISMRETYIDHYPLKDIIDFWLLWWSNTGANTFVTFSLSLPQIFVECSRGVNYFVVLPPSNCIDKC